MTNKIKTISISIFTVAAAIFIFSSCSKDDGPPPIQVGSWDAIRISERSLDGEFVSSDTTYSILLFEKNGTGLEQHQNRAEEKIIDWEVDENEKTIRYWVEGKNNSGGTYKDLNAYDIIISIQNIQEWHTTYRVKPGGSDRFFDVDVTKRLTRIE
ncbi:MAG TPA: hypothetical protein ENJ28_10965 [Gammaproteobacteria bacterium]|nr:hypothetical protein [Gammaproteobacteria bacterium]